MSASKAARTTDDEFAGQAARVLLLGLLIAVVLLGVYAFRPDVLPGWFTDLVPVSSATARLVVICSGVVAVAGSVLWGVARSMRRRRTRFAAGLTSELPEGYDPQKHCRPTRWRKGRPQDVLLQLPDQFADTTAAQQKLTKALGERMGAKVQGKWKPGRGTVRFRPVATKPADVARDRGRERVAGLAAELFSGKCTVSKVGQWGGPDGVLPVAFALGYPYTTKDNSAPFRRRVEVDLGAKLGVRLRGQWDPVRDHVWLEPRPPLAEYLPHPGPEQFTGEDPFFLPLGVNEENEVRGWNTRRDPHALANGSTGSGKTSAVRSAITAALCKSWEVYLADIKRIEFSGYRLGPRGGWGVQSIATREEDIADMLIRLRELMEARYAEGQANIEAGQDPRWDDYRPVLVVLDEFTELVLAMGDLSKARQLKGTPEAVSAVDRMARLARVCHIHLVVLMQRPDADSFPSGARDNFTYRISLNALSEQGARMMWGNTEWGRSLPAIKGRGMAGVYGSEPEEVQFYWTPDPAFPPPQDEALRNKLRTAAEDAQQHTTASLAEERGYDLGPLKPSTEVAADELTPGAGDLAEVQLPGGETGETATVSAETLTRGDRIIHEGAVYTVRRVTDLDDDEIKIVIKPRRGVRNRDMVLALTDRVARVDELSGGTDDEPDGAGEDLDDAAGGPAPEPMTDLFEDYTTLGDEADTDSETTEQPPFTAQLLDLYGDGNEHRGNGADDHDEPGEMGAVVAMAADLVVENRLGSVAMIRREVLHRPAGDEAAEAEATSIMDELERRGIVGPAPDSPTAPRTVLVDAIADAEPEREPMPDLEPPALHVLDTHPDPDPIAPDPTPPAQSSQPEPPTPVDAKATSPSRPTAAGGVQVSDLTGGERVILKNRKGAKVTYTVKKVQLGDDNTVHLNLKPARGRERVEDLPAADTIELAQD